jgi:hypothetical protein
MKRLILSVYSVMALSWGDVGGAPELVMDNEAKPAIGERLNKDTVKGTLMKIDGESYWVKDTNGKEIKLHVDLSTKRDKVIVGDKVKAHVVDNGHATMLQRAE